MRLSGKILLISAACLALCSMPVWALQGADRREENNMILLARKPADSAMEPLYAYYYDGNGAFRSRAEFMPDGNIGMIHYCDNDRWLGSLILHNETEETVSFCFSDDNNMCQAADEESIDDYQVWLRADPDVGEYYSRAMGFSVSAVSNANNAGLIYCREGEPVFEVCFDDQGGLDHVLYGNDLENEFAPAEEVTEEKGDKVSRYFCRVSGDPDAVSDDYQIRRTRTYDLNGRLISYLYESSSGLPYDEPFICCTFDYNEDGKLRYKYRKTDHSEYEAFFDDNGQLSALHDVHLEANFLYSYNADGSLSCILMDTTDIWSGLSEKMTPGEFIQEVQNSSREEYPGMVIAKYDQAAGTCTMETRMSDRVSVNSIRPTPSDMIRSCLEKEGTEETVLFSGSQNTDVSYTIYENEEEELCYVLAGVRVPAAEAEYSPGKVFSMPETLNETVRHLAEVISE